MNTDFHYDPERRLFLPVMGYGSSIPLPLLVKAYHRNFYHIEFPGTEKLRDLAFKFGALAADLAKIRSGASNTNQKEQNFRYEIGFLIKLIFAAMCHAAKIHFKAPLLLAADGRSSFWTIRLVGIDKQTKNHWIASAAIGNEDIPAEDQDKVYAEMDKRRPPRERQQGVTVDKDIPYPDDMPQQPPERTEPTRGRIPPMFAVSEWMLMEPRTKLAFEMSQPFHPGWEHPVSRDKMLLVDMEQVTGYETPASYYSSLVFGKVNNPIHGLPSITVLGWCTPAELMRNGYRTEVWVSKWFDKDEGYVPTKYKKENNVKPLFTAKWKPGRKYTGTVNGVHQYVDIVLNEARVKQWHYVMPQDSIYLHSMDEWLLQHEGEIYRNVLGWSLKIKNVVENHEKVHGVTTQVQSEVNVYRSANGWTPKSEPEIHHELGANA